MILGIHNYAELTAAIVCTICLIYKPSVLNRWFVLFLWTTVVIELMGKLTTKMLEVKIPMYNLFNGAEFLFYLSLLAVVAKWQGVRTVLRVFFLVFGLFFIVNLLFIQGFYIYNAHTHTAGAVLLIAGALLVLFKISASDTNELGWLKWPLMWVLFGVLVFYTGNLFNTSLYNYQSEKNPAQAVKLYRLINHNLNVVLYLFCSIAFVLEVKRNRIPNTS